MAAILWGAEVTLRKFFRAIAPNFLIELREKSRNQERAAQREKFHAERRLRLSSIQKTQTSKVIQGDDYCAVIGFLKDRQLPEAQLLEGSMPESSLEFVREQAIMQMESDRPLIALHIGNFVGVSLAYFSATLKLRHPDSLVISVDPNLSHRGIANPQAHVAALLTACDLQRNTMIIAGYSGKKSISNDGVVFEGYDPSIEFAKEFACEQIVRNLKAFSRQCFDLIVIDGNHDKDYLRGEITALVPLLKKGGFLIVDDVDSSWAEIQAVFLEISDFGLQRVGTDGRVGIARLL